MAPEDGAITRGRTDLTGFGLVEGCSADYSIEQSRRFVISGHGQDRPATFEIVFQEKKPSQAPKQEVHYKTMEQGLP